MKYKIASNITLGGNANTLFKRKYTKNPAYLLTSNLDRKNRGKWIEYSSLQNAPLIGATVKPCEMYDGQY